MAGPAHTWPFRDPLDFASLALPDANVAPTVTMTDQVLGTGDGAITSFQLQKTYTRGSQTYTRLIHLPIVNTVLVSIGGADPAGFSPPINWTVSRPGGVVEFESPPGPGAIIRAGFLFDVEVRFEGDDAFDGIVRSYQISGFADVNLVEVRPC
jgi:uncharacterized protein (TIGR02217 family)